MDKKVSRYYQLKKKQKEMELELSELRQEIMDYCTAHGESMMEIGSYKVKITRQERKEYDDNKVYNALPDPSVWKMLSKVDTAKVTGLLKLNVLTEQSLSETYTVKNISSLIVEKK